MQPVPLNPIQVPNQLQRIHDVRVKAGSTSGAHAAMVLAGRRDESSDIDGDDDDAGVQVGKLLRAFTVLSSSICFFNEKAFDLQGREDESIGDDNAILIRNKYMR